LRGDAAALSRRSAAMAMAKVFFILVTMRRAQKTESVATSKVSPFINTPAIYILSQLLTHATLTMYVSSNIDLSFF
jgi:uncharacterized membrane protein